MPATWQASDAVQVTGVPAQAPPVHASPLVQAFPSLHAEPLAAVGFEHAPLDGSQVPAT